MKITRTEAAGIITRFINDEAGEYEWDDFISRPIEDSFVSKIRDECVKVFDEYPSTNGSEYCSVKGVEMLANLAKILEESENR